MLNYLPARTQAKAAENYCPEARCSAGGGGQAFKGRHRSEPLASNTYFPNQLKTLKRALALVAPKPFTPVRGVNCSA